MFPVLFLAMLLYRKSSCWFLPGLPLLMRFIGSALPHAVFPALFSTILAVVFEFAVPEEVCRALRAVRCVPPSIDRWCCHESRAQLLESFFDHPYPFQVFAYIVAFALVFRTNIAYARYWEMRSSVVHMSCKWGDCAALALGFEEDVWDAAVAATAARAPPASSAGSTPEASRSHSSSKPSLRPHAILPTLKLQAALRIDEEPDDARGTFSPIEPPAAVEARRSQALLVHRVSLMHALALQYLRRDNSLANLHDASTAAEDADAADPASVAEGMLGALFGTA